MTKEKFQNFVDETLEEIIQLAEKKSGQKLSRKIAFRRLLRNDEPIMENVAAYITERVFMDENNISPCVDIGVQDVLDDGTLLIFASVSGHSPRPWGINWQGREGPFVYAVGQPFLDKIVIELNK
ncbi:MAG: hypothetical protein M3T96_10325 [Acidobacteriota bacterium]|nr:hypothetical protein [Acidobacteriota bacterium]